MNSGIWHQSEKKLTFLEIMLFAQAAKSSHYFDRYIQWLESALELEKSQQWTKKLQKMIKKAKLDHDKAFKASLVSTYANIGSPQTNQNLIRKIKTLVFNLTEYTPCAGRNRTAGSRWGPYTAGSSMTQNNGIY